MRGEYVKLKHRPGKGRDPGWDSTRKRQDPVLHGAKAVCLPKTLGPAPEIARWDWLRR